MLYFHMSWEHRAQGQPGYRPESPWYRPESFSLSHHCPIWILCPLFFFFFFSSIALEAEKMSNGTNYFLFQKLARGTDLLTADYSDDLWICLCTNSITEPTKILCRILNQLINWLTNYICEKEENYVLFIFDHFIIFIFLTEMLIYNTAHFGSLLIMFLRYSGQFLSKDMMQKVTGYS